jgi:hypothetical protein
MDSPTGRQSKAQRDTGLDHTPYKKYLVRLPELGYVYLLTVIRA